MKSQTTTRAVTGQTARGFSAPATLENPPCKCCWPAPVFHMQRILGQPQPWERGRRHGRSPRRQRLRLFHCVLAGLDSHPVDLLLFARGQEVTAAHLLAAITTDGSRQANRFPRTRGDGPPKPQPMVSSLSAAHIGLPPLPALRCGLEKICPSETSGFNGPE